MIQLQAKNIRIQWSKVKGLNVEGSDLKICFMQN